MDRRTFLGAGAALGIAGVGGCTGCARAPSASLRLDPITDRGVAERIVGRFEAGPRSDRYRIVSGAVENGTATSTGTEPLVRTDEAIIYDGTVYEFDVEVVGSEPATAFQMTLNPVEGRVAESETVRFEDLPAVDRRTFAARGWDEMGFLGFVTSILYLDAELPRSALVPEPRRSVIVWGSETRGRFSVDGSYATARNTYRYTPTVVHASASAYGRALRERYAFTVDGLTPEERAILERATDEGGYVVPAGESPPAAVRVLADRFRAHESVRRSRRTQASSERTATGSYLVRYEGAVYWASVRFREPSSTPRGS